MEVFAKFDKLLDVIILEKRNRVSWKYAFARFHEWNDVEALEKKLDNIWIGSVKLRANVSKFKGRIITMVENIHRKKKSITNQALLKENVSFVEVIKYNKKTCNPQKKDKELENVSPAHTFSAYMSIVNS